MLRYGWTVQQQSFHRVYYAILIYSCVCINNIPVLLIKETLDCGHKTATINTNAIVHFLSVALFIIHAGSLILVLPIRYFLSITVV